MRGNASRYPDKKLSQASAESALIDYLVNVRAPLRPAITVDTILHKYAVPPKVAQYHLMLAQQRWAAE